MSPLLQSIPRNWNKHMGCIRRDALVLFWMQNEKSIFSCQVIVAKSLPLRIGDLQMRWLWTSCSVVFVWHRQNQGMWTCKWALCDLGLQEWDHYSADTPLWRAIGLCQHKTTAAWTGRRVTLVFVQLGKDKHETGMVTFHCILVNTFSNTTSAKFVVL